MTLDTGAEPVIPAIGHHGAGHFVVDALDGGLRAGSQPVYTDGPFVCRALVDGDDRPVRALRVKAEGPWTVEVVPVTAAVTPEDRTERPASDVLRHEGGPAIAEVRYEGDRYDSGGYVLADTFAPDGHGFLDELANRVGPWRGEAPLPGPCLVYARADGPWSVVVRRLED